MARRIRWILPVLVACGVAAATAATSHAGPKGDPSTQTPIKHVVVIFQENVSFDHYFGTYPYATNQDGNTFTAAQGTPAVNGLNWSLLAANPNTANPKRLVSTALGPANDPGTGQITCDMDHNYSDEQQAEDSGEMDLFVQSLGGTFGNVPGVSPSVPCSSVKKVVMDYYDGNTVTGLWNYAQHYAMSDNSFNTTYGPSAPGAINLVSGNTGGVDTSRESGNPGSVTIATSKAPNADITADGKGGYSLTSDAQPYWDDCSTRDAVALKGENIGDLLNEHHLSWGWFQGGFAPTTSFAAAATQAGHPNQSTSDFIPDEFQSFAAPAGSPTGTSKQGICDAVHAVGTAFGANTTNVPVSDPFGLKDDYIAHHEPFQYYASTANPHHLPEPNLSKIGWDTQSYVNGVPQFDTANHNYDTSDFDAVVNAVDNHVAGVDLPAVSFIKAPGYEDGHAQYSDPKDEQAFVVHIINELEQSPDWSSTAVFINYDDSDGWYDHVVSPVINQSHSVADNLTNTVADVPDNGTSGICAPARESQVGDDQGNQQDDGIPGPLAGEQGRCGFGPRLPMLVISPWAKTNYVDHNLSDQASIINFVEDNWHLPGIPGSFDRVLSPLDHQEGVKFDLGGMFDFNAPPNTTPVLLSPSTGEVTP
jgi:phospholipase C